MIKYKLSHKKKHTVSTSLIRNKRITIGAGEEKVISFTDYKRFELPIEGLRKAGVLSVTKLEGKVAEASPLTVEEAIKSQSEIDAEKVKLEEERLAEEARLEEERLAEEARLEEERLAEEEALRLEEEAEKEAEEARLAEEEAEKQRKEAEEAEAKAKKEKEEAELAKSKSGNARKRNKK